jgi:hypothetical protein
MIRTDGHEPAADQPEESTHMVATPAQHEDRGSLATGSRLSERDCEILDFERQWWKYAGAKEQAVRERFEMSTTRYYQVLNALIDRPEALAHDLHIGRLRPAIAPMQLDRLTVILTADYAG